MKQAERISEASFLVNHMSYQSGMTRAFKQAAKVFQYVLDNYGGRLIKPTLKELNNLPSDIDDDFDCYFYTKRLNLSCFCDKLSAEIYAIIDREIREDADGCSNYETYEKWCDFVNHFNERKFSKLFQKSLLTSRAVRSFENFDGEKVLEVGSNDNLWEFVDEYSSDFIRERVCES